ncbi:hypothetical protein CGRA01v4_08042 [Colletotrichum graminicola]|nr:hypothetical protein CGRA01v4_08042 [Colletotrichum graminicola]
MPGPGSEPTLDTGPRISVCLSVCLSLWGALSLPGFHLLRGHSGLFLALGTGALSAVLEDLKATPTTHHGSNSQHAHRCHPISISPRRKIIEEQRPHGHRNPSHGSHLATIYITHPTEQAKARR